MRFPVRFCATAMLLGSVAMAAQAPSVPSAAPNGQQQTPVPTLTVSTRLVVLDITVTDKKGNLVEHKLTQDDFTIDEDGQPQRIRSFEAPNEHRFMSGTQPVVTSAADLTKIGDAPVTILVLDELNSRFEDMSFSREMLVKYLQSQPAVLKEPTVLMVAMNTTFQQIHDYTQNRDELIEVVKKHMPEYPWRMMNSGKKGPGAVERMAQVLAALQQIAQSSAGTPGRKNLIWVGNGFPSADLVGLDDRTSALITAAVRRCTSRLLAARVTMYSINPAPGSSATLDVESPDDLDEMLDANSGDPFSAGTVSFSSLAPSTGGLAFTGRNDLNNVIREGIDKGQEYYTISYSPTNASQDLVKFRNIRVVMKDPNLRGITRTGYYPDTTADLNPAADKTMPPKQAVANLELDLSAALTSTISYNGLNLTATKASGGSYTVHVAEKGIKWSDANSDGAQRMEATVAAGWYSASGKLLGHTAREETAIRGNGAGGVDFTLPITMPAGAKRLRLVVRDALSGQMGTFDVTDL
jgi:VWFA-related protein